MKTCFAIIVLVFHAIRVLVLYVFVALVILSVLSAVLGLPMPFTNG